jgi:hypothetical protein
MEIARVVERDEQREVLELEPIDECDGCGVLAHEAGAIRFVDRPIPTTD